LKISNAKKGDGVTVEHLPIKHEAWSSTPVPPKKKKKKNKAKDIVTVKEIIINEIQEPLKKKKTYLKNLNVNFY
jgi:hypothetical protein